MNQQFACFGEPLPHYVGAGLFPRVRLDAGRDVLRDRLAVVVGFAGVSGYFAQVFVGEFARASASAWLTLARFGCGGVQFGRGQSVWDRVDVVHGGK